jgi:hypothetical protein
VFTLVVFYSNLVILMLHLDTLRERKTTVTALMCVRRKNMAVVISHQGQGD